MKYLIDAQLPKRLCLSLQNKGYDVKHTLDLPDKNKTKDQFINVISINEKRVVMSKDSDFVDSLLISAKPFKLLYVATGNISNDELFKIVLSNMIKIDEAFETNRFIELTSKTFIIHQ